MFSNFFFFFNPAMTKTSCLILNKLLDNSGGKDWGWPLVYPHLMWKNKWIYKIQLKKNQMKNCLMDTNPPCLFKRGGQQEALNWCDCLISACSYWSCGYCCLFADGAKKAGPCESTMWPVLQQAAKESSFQSGVLGPIGVLTERPRGPKHWNQFSFLFFFNP